jgi:antitoxin (DNA-binding transcriptional repressor) of toxin-antitoxin stability system
MQRLSLQQAATQLATLAEKAKSGEQVILTAGDGMTYCLVPIWEFSMATPKGHFDSAWLASLPKAQKTIPKEMTFSREEIYDETM